MATIVFSEALRLDTMAFGSRSRPSFARSSWASFRAAFSRMVPSFVGKPDPSAMLSRTDSVGTSPSSCCTKRQPSR